MQKIDKNTYLSAEKADELRVALDRCKQGKPIYASWILEAVGSKLSMEEIERRLDPLGYEVNWSKIRCYKLTFHSEVAA